jgi:hypothetical protein
MKRTSFLLVLLLAGGLLMLGQTLVAQEAPANVAGTWEMTSEGRNGPMTQTLTIKQDGATIKGTLSGPRGEAPFEGTVAGSKISFTIKRETPNGTFTLEYSATVNGDSMEGTVHSERFDRKFTAKRGK